MEVAKLETGAMRACAPCRRAKTACDEQRPCPRCLRLNIECCTADIKPKKTACLNCHKAKSACDANPPCSRCLRLGVECRLPESRKSAKRAKTHDSDSYPSKKYQARHNTRSASLNEFDLVLDKVRHIPTVSPKGILAIAPPSVPEIAATPAGAPWHNNSYGFAGEEAKYFDAETEAAMKTLGGPISGQAATHTSPLLQREFVGHVISPNISPLLSSSFGPEIMSLDHPVYKFDDFDLNSHASASPSTSHATQSYSSSSSRDFCDRSPSSLTIFGTMKSLSPALAPSSLVALGLSPKLTATATHTPEPGNYPGQ